jgi:hypothetical protein
MPIGQRPLGDAPMMATDRAATIFSTGLRENELMRYPLPEIDFAMSQS